MYGEKQPPQLHRGSPVHAAASDFVLQVLGVPLHHISQGSNQQPGVASQLTGSMGPKHSWVSHFIWLGSQWQGKVPSQLGASQYVTQMDLLQWPLSQ